MFGLNDSITLSSVLRVIAWLRSYPYFPSQRNVLPSSIFIPLRLTWRSFKKLIALRSKSLPTVATTPTSVKKLAELVKWRAEPPRTFSTFPKGVWMESYATVPTTRSLIMFPSPRKPGISSVLQSTCLS